MARHAGKGKGDLYPLNKFCKKQTFALEFRSTMFAVSQTLYPKSKWSIIVAIRRVLEIFDVKRGTCLRSNWLRRDSVTSYFNTIANFHWETRTAVLEDGGLPLLAHVSPAEPRYTAIEGEALAVALVLNKLSISPKVVTTSSSLQTINLWLSSLDVEHWMRWLNLGSFDSSNVHSHGCSTFNTCRENTSKQPMPHRGTFHCQFQQKAQHLALQASRFNRDNADDVCTQKHTDLGTITLSLIVQETAAGKSLSHLKQLIYWPRHTKSKRQRRIASEEERYLQITIC